jgi:uncharacterized membrane protein
MDLLIDRWLHIMAGITWIGLLYYFNFIQVPSMARIKEDGSATAITKFIAPKALLWFRWAALVTWLTGAYYLERSGIGLANAFLLKGAAAYIGLGVWMGTIMLFNVWVLIWPNQKKVCTAGISYQYHAVHSYAVFHGCRQYGTHEYHGFLLMIL